MQRNRKRNLQLLVCKPVNVRHDAAGRYGDISLSDIAGTADIGERECLRCFQKTIQLSPIQYLLKYRIMQGAEMLLCCPESSISDIALSCGFDSPSNFAATFKRFYNRTPREYRKTETL